jgi:hypothetical protein
MFIFYKTLSIVQFHWFTSTRSSRDGDVRCKGTNNEGQSINVSLVLKELTVIFQGTCKIKKSTLIAILIE